MRTPVIIVAVAFLGACGQQAAPKDQAKVTQAAVLTFDGAQTSDRPKMLAHGERLSHVLGCRGCHEPDLTGRLFNADYPENGKLYASNLTQVLPTMSDSQLEQLLREGTHPTRGELWIMPSEVFQRLSAPDMAALIAHLRTVKPTGKPTPAPVFTAKGRADIASGKERPSRAWVLRYRKEVAPDFGNEHAYGRYLTSNTCSECHGGNLKGIEGFAPNLDVVGAYSEAELATLLTTGKGNTARDIGLMGRVGKNHFGYLTPRERAAIIAYVKARAARVSS